MSRENFIKPLTNNKPAILINVISYDNKKQQGLYFQLFIKILIENINKRLSDSKKKSRKGAQAPVSVNILNDTLIHQLLLLNTGDFFPYFYNEAETNWKTEHESLIQTEKVLQNKYAIKGWKELIRDHESYPEARYFIQSLFAQSSEFKQCVVIEAEKRLQKITDNPNYKIQQSSISDIQEKILSGINITEQKEEVRILARTLEDTIGLIVLDKIVGAQIKLCAEHGKDIYAKAIITYPAKQLNGPNNYLLEHYLTHLEFQGYQIPEESVKKLEKKQYQELSNNYTVQTSNLSSLNSIPSLLAGNRYSYLNQKFAPNLAGDSAKKVRPIIPGYLEKKINELNLAGDRESCFLDEFHNLIDKYDKFEGSQSMSDTGTASYYEDQLTSLGLSQRQIRAFYSDFNNLFRKYRDTNTFEQQYYNPIARHN
jgi:hypothetical protein